MHNNLYKKQRHFKNTVAAKFEKNSTKLQHGAVKSQTYLTMILLKFMKAFLG